MPDRITDRRSRNRVAKLLQEAVNSKGQRGMARLLHINPGTVKHIITNTDASWKHVILNQTLVSKIELASAYIAIDADLSIEIQSKIDEVMQRESDLAQSLRELRRLLRKM